MLCRLLNEITLPDMPIAFNPDDWPSDDEDVGGGPFFGYCNVPKLTSNLPFPDLTSPEALSCGNGCSPFTESDKRQEQAIFLGRPTGKAFTKAYLARCMILNWTHALQPCCQDLSGPCNRIA